MKLFDYYTKTCEWTSDEAIEHIRGLFRDGTIDIIKAL